MSRVLVVDDEATLTDLLVSYLRTVGVEAVEAHSAQEALPLILSGGFELVICDVRMPGDSGKVLAERVHALMSAPPVWYFLTAYSDFSTEELLATGADRVLRKPDDVGPLLRELTQRFGTGPTGSTED